MNTNHAIACPLVFVQEESPASQAAQALVPPVEKNSPVHGVHVAPAVSVVPPSPDPAGLIGSKY